MDETVAVVLMGFAVVAFAGLVWELYIWLAASERRRKKTDEVQQRERSR